MEHPTLELLPLGVRDSKQANGPAFVVPAAAWSAFVDMVR
ncbi:DUF397 domain-containing protein [Streptomyces syringium]|nr:DUF397 domain-containing protein [Streptomyces syringium]